MDANPQDWLPPSSEVDAAARTATVKRPSSGNVLFGAIPAGWTINVKGYPKRVAAESVGSGVRLSVKGGARYQTLRIEGGFEVVDLRGDWHSHIALTTEGTTVVVGSAGATVDGQVEDIRIHIDAGDTEEAPVAGRARISTVSGKGNCSIASSLSEGAVITGYEGVLSLERNSAGLRVDAPGAAITIKGNLRDGDVQAAALRVTGKLANSRVEARLHCNAKVASASSITVTEPNAGGQAILIGQFTGVPDNVPPLTIDLDQDETPAPKWIKESQESAAVLGSTLRSEGDGAIIVGPAADSSLESEGSVWVHGDLRWANPGASGGNEDPTSTFSVRGASLWVEGVTQAQARLEIDVQTDLFAESVDGPTSLRVGRVLLAGALRRVAGSMDVAHVKGDVERAELKAFRITVLGDVRAGRLDVIDDAVVHGSVDRETEIVARNAVEFHARMDGQLIMKQGQPDQPDQPARIVLHMSANSIRCEAARTVLKAGSLTVQRLDVCGDVVVMGSPSPNDPDPELQLMAVEHHTDHAGSALIIANHLPTVIYDLTCADATALIGATTARDQETWWMWIKIGASAAVEVASERNVTLDRSSVEGSARAAPEILLRGPGTYTIRHDVAAMTTEASPPAWWPLREGQSSRWAGVEASPPSGVPVVEVAEGVTVANASGRLRLRSLAGTLVGPDKADGRESQAAVLLGMDPAGRKGGRLVGVDPTRLPVEDIDALRQLNVFDPDPRALRDYAKDKAADDVHRHERAQRAQLLAEVVNERATSGNVRSWTFWAAARTRHALVKGPVERLGRLVHRLMGYGYRPGPALLTWLLSVSIVGLGAAATEPMREALDVQDGAMGSPKYWWAQVMRVLLLPLSLLRLPELTPSVPSHGYVAQAHEEGVVPLLWDWPLAHSFVFLVTGLTLSFFVVALKNYLQSPIDR